MNPLHLRRLLLDPQDPTADGGGAPVPPDDGGDPNPQPTGNEPQPGSQEMETLKSELQTIKDQLQHAQSSNPVQAQVETYQRLATSFQKAGYSPEQAQAYATAMLAGDIDDGEGQPRRQTARQMAGVDDPDDGGFDPRDAEIANLKRSLTELSQGQRNQYMDQLKTQLRSSLDGALDSHKGLNTLMQSIPEDRRDSVKKRWAARLDRDTRALLSERRQKARGGWDNSWISEAAAKAATDMYEDFRAGIPDPSKLGPGETVTEAQEFLKTKPVPAPKYEPGQSVADVQASFRNFALDSLLRGQAEVAAGSSRV